MLNSLLWSAGNGLSSTGSAFTPSPRAACSRSITFAVIKAPVGAPPVLPLVVCSARGAATLVAFFSFGRRRLPRPLCLISLGAFLPHVFVDLSAETGVEVLPGIPFQLLVAKLVASLGEFFPLLAHLMAGLESLLVREIHLSPLDLILQGVATLLPGRGRLVA